MTNISLKHILQGLFELKEHITELYQSIKMQVGDEANYVREWYDLRRIQQDVPDATEIEGDALFAEVLQFCWKTGKDYVWNYKGQRFRVTPFKSGTTDDGGFIFYFGVKHSLVNFAGTARDAVDTDCSIWEAIVARMYGIADGYCSAIKQSKLEHVCAEMPAPDAEVAEDLKWKPSYGVDPAEVIKVPEGADGTLACADPEPCPEEVPVIEQAEEPVPKPKPNWKEKRAKEKDLIRAGGNLLPDGNSDMTDEQKAEYERWKQSVESPQRYG